MNALFEKSPCDCRNKSHVGQSMSKGHYIFILQMSFYGSCFKKQSWPIHFQMPLWQICFAKPILWSHGSKSQVGQSISKCQYMAYTYYKSHFMAHCSKSNFGQLCFCVRFKPFCVAAILPGDQVRPKPLHPTKASSTSHGQLQDGSHEGQQGYEGHEGHEVHRDHTR